MPKKSLTEKKLERIGKSLADLESLNDTLKPYKINVAYIPRRGWRAFAIGSAGPGVASTATRWMGEVTLLKWMEDPETQAQNTISYMRTGIVPRTE
ncbi:MAG TPA: hypothetical protein V6D29_25935 [Leptolyngbyaceae cyanobacterium]